MFYIPLERAFHLLSNGINNFAVSASRSNRSMSHSSIKKIFPAELACLVLDWILCSLCCICNNKSLKPGQLR